MSRSTKNVVQVPGFSLERPLSRPDAIRDDGSVKVWFTEMVAECCSNGELFEVFLEGSLPYIRCAEDSRWQCSFYGVAWMHKAYLVWLILSE